MAAPMRRPVNRCVLAFGISYYRFIAGIGAWRSFCAGEALHAEEIRIRAKFGDILCRKPSSRSACRISADADVGKGTVAWLVVQQRRAVKFMYRNRGETKF